MGVAKSATARAVGVPAHLCAQGMLMRLSLSMADRRVTRLYGRRREVVGRGEMRQLVGKELRDELVRGLKLGSWSPSHCEN